MIQGNFSGMVGLKSIRFSGSQFCFGVKTLYDSAGELLFGPEPVQQKGAMPPQHLGHFLHGFKL